MDVKGLPDGVFDLFMGIETHTSDPVRAGLTMSYSCHKTDGEKVVVCDGLYVATNNGGRWGLEISSTISTPIEHLGIQHQEAIDNVFKRGRDWMEGWSNSDADLLDSTRGLLGRSVSLYPNIAGARDRLDHRFRAEGVESRLRVIDTAETTPGNLQLSSLQGERSRPRRRRLRVHVVPSRCAGAPSVGEQGARRRWLHAFPGGWYNHLSHAQSIGPCAAKSPVGQRRRHRQYDPLRRNQQ